MSRVQEIVILSRRRRISVPAISLISLWLFVNVALCQPRSIVIKVINGKTGKPIAHARLVLFGGKSQEDAKFKVQYLNDATTAADGTVIYHIDPNATAWVQVFADGRTTCFDNPNFRAFSIQKVIQTGESTPNNCRKTPAQNTPGVFIVFARDATIWEGLAW
jgi:hypothetical protein